MKCDKSEGAVNTDSLIFFIQNNNNLDILTYDFQQEAVLKQLNFGDLEEHQQTLDQVKSYQRLIRIIPDQNHEVAILLIQEKIQSALEITSMTRKDFIATFIDAVSPDIALGKQIYQNALNKRSAILMQYINLLQNNEPHIRSARFS